MAAFNTGTKDQDGILTTTPNATTTALHTYDEQTDKDWDDHSTDSHSHSDRDSDSNNDCDSDNNTGNADRLNRDDVTLETHKRRPTRRTWPTWRTLPTWPTGTYGWRTLRHRRRRHYHDTDAHTPFKSFIHIQLTDLDRRKCFHPQLQCWVDGSTDGDTYPFIFSFHIHRLHAHTSFASILAVHKFNVNSHSNYCIKKKMSKKVTKQKKNWKIHATLRLTFNKVESL